MLRAVRRARPLNCAICCQQNDLTSHHWPPHPALRYSGRVLPGNCLAPHRHLRYCRLLGRAASCGPCWPSASSSAATSSRERGGVADSAAALSYRMSHRTVGAGSPSPVRPCCSSETGSSCSCSWYFFAWSGTVCMQRSGQLTETSHRASSSRSNGALNLARQRCGSHYA